MMVCRQGMSSDAEEILDESVHRQKSLRLAAGIESSHLTQTLPSRFVGDFRAVVSQGVMMWDDGRHDPSEGRQSSSACP